MMNEAQTNKLNLILLKAGDTSFRRRVVKVIEYLDVHPGDRILDCGCGEGFYTMVLKELYGDQCQIISLDMDRVLLKKAVTWVGKGLFVCSSVMRLPFGDGMFDKVILSEVLEHIEDDAKSLGELKRVLKPDGILALTVPNHNYPMLWDPLNKVREMLGLGHFSPDNGFFGGLWAMHIRLYYLSDIESLVSSAGFSILEKDMITHYCLPFNHNILYAGKRMSGWIPLPASYGKATEKFDWKNGQKGLMGFLAKCFMKAVNSIDRKNDSAEAEYSKSSVCIGLKLLNRT